MIDARQGHYKPLAGFRRKGVLRSIECARLAALLGSARHRSLFGDEHVHSNKFVHSNLNFKFWSSILVNMRKMIFNNEKFWIKILDKCFIIKHMTTFNSVLGARRCPEGTGRRCQKTILRKVKEPSIGRVHLHSYAFCEPMHRFPVPNPGDRARF